MSSRLTLIHRMQKSLFRTLALLFGLPLGGAMISLSLATSLSHAAPLELKTLATYETGLFKKSAAEIVVFQPGTQNIFVVNGAAPSVDVLRLTPGNKLEKHATLTLTAVETPTSVAVRHDLIAVAVHNDALPQRPGKILLFNNSFQRIAEFPAGSLPDMVSFTPDGRYVLAANEGEPRDGVDPSGSVTIIDLVHGLSRARVIQAGFEGFSTRALIRQGVRIAPGKSFAEDAEPEYIAPAADSRRAWVSLQENNALAEIDLVEGRISRILPLGLKDHSHAGQGLDANDKDGINIRPLPLYGMYMPDAIATLTHEDRTFILTANEGDAREEEIKAGKAPLDETRFPKDLVAAFKKLRISGTDGDLDGDGDIDRIHSYGARSFSVFSEQGTLLFDSGDQFEQITARHLGKDGFNSDNDEGASADKRSDNKGPEPEGLTIGVVDGRTYAFIGLERVGGIMVYDVTDPTAPQFSTYINNRVFNKELDFSRTADIKAAGPLGPEGISFIPADDSPTGKPLLLVAYEISGTVEVMEIN